MIPYIEQHIWQLGPIPIQVWGFFVALGILVGLWVSARRAEKLGLEKKHIYDVGTWIILAALLGARIMHIVFYDGATYVQDPLEIFRVWNGGFSITGGFIGALIVAWFYFKKHGLDVWKYADATIFGLPLGLGIGRIGCFLIHDHPGTATDFAMGMEYPDGVVRHDHGLYLSINGFILAIVFALLARKKQPVGMFLAVFAVWYGIMRFFLDFYRAADVTYLGLTPAQYTSVLMLVAGVWGIWRILGGRAKIQRHNK
ncbi:prolipoprotein diacylglyceryl transferase [Candidatus Uhrbacteria bacterium]|jgi:phosphatidylglycerol---prolipoprotein diacylglyceryl transferase|nr:prolipoprotein diacylglyceryl transferase [Candidatus Uhrbacteria bacterium]